MYDAIDLASYQVDGTIRIDQEKFIENFLNKTLLLVKITFLYRYRYF